MSATKNYADQLGKAWASHRNGRNSDAISAFNTILAEDDSQIDGLYGLGLAQRANGETALALDTFQRCLAVTIKRLLEDPGNDQFEMMQRMVEQRLSELRVRSA